MAKPKILVTGATGKTGGAVVEALLGKGMQVRAQVRGADARSAALERRGVEVVVADLFDPDQMLDALRGTQRAYYNAPWDPYAIQAAAAFAVAAREAKLESIVQLSQWVSHRAHPSIATRQTWLMDRLFADIPGISHTIVNPGMFADNFLRVINYSALLWVYPSVSGDGEAAPVSNEDIARVVAAVLDAPERHDGMRYRPTGPALMSAREMARVIAKVVGHPVIRVDMPWWLYLKAARQQRASAMELSGYRYYMQDMKRGVFSFETGVNSVVEELTGTPAEGFETTARRYAAMPFARQTIGNRLSLFGLFNVMPMLPGYNLDRWDRQRGFPVAQHPTLAIDDERWRSEHSQQNARRPAARGMERMQPAAVR